jgi:hypothetical protein
MNHKSTSLALFVSISPEQRERAKEIAKSKGMTLQGWLGQLVLREIDKTQNAEVVNG